MWRQVLAVTAGVWIGCGSAVFAQQDPLDEGLADSVTIVLSQAYQNGACRVTVDVFYFNDVQSLRAASVFLSWDHPGLEYDSLNGTPLADSVFDAILGMNKTTAQQNQYQAFATVSLDESRLAPSTESRKMGSLYFHLNDWQPGDSIYFDTTSLIGLRLEFVTTESRRYGPGWPGRTSIELKECNPTVVEQPSADQSLPADYFLAQNYPNPFNPSTMIDYKLPTAANVELVVFNELGQRVATLVRGLTPPGQHQAFWNGCNGRGEPAASGVYLYRLTAGDFTQSRKMLLLK